MRIFRSTLPGNVFFSRTMGDKPVRSPHPVSRFQATEGRVAIIRLHEVQAQRLTGGSAKKRPRQRTALAQGSITEPPDSRPKDMQSLHPRRQQKNRVFALSKNGDSKIENRGSGTPRVQTTITPWDCLPQEPVVRHRQGPPEGSSAARSDIAPIDSK